MKVEFNLEGNPEPAFYALYAGLRMFLDKKIEEDKLTSFLFNPAGAEAYGMLQDLKEQFPTEFKEAEIEYNQTLKK